MTACNSPSSLVVDLRTDFDAQSFSGVRVEVDLPDRSVHRTEHLPATGGDYLRGVRIAELTGLDAAVYPLRVTLFDRDGDGLITQTLAVSVDGPTAVTVLITRSCVDVSCEELGRRQCLGGRCEVESCTLEQPGTCELEPECDTRRPCTAPGTDPACFAQSCEAGLCFSRPDDNRCTDGETCDASAGCQPAPGSCVPIAPVQLTSDVNSADVVETADGFAVAQWNPNVITHFDTEGQQSGQFMLNFMANDATARTETPARFFVIGELSGDSTDGCQAVDATTGDVLVEPRPFLNTRFPRRADAIGQGNRIHVSVEDTSREPALITADADCVEVSRRITPGDRPISDGALWGRRWPATPTPTCVTSAC